MFITIPARTSAAVELLLVAPINGVVYCEFTNGYAYEYTHVSRRAIVNLMLNPNMSLGFWINKNLVNSKRAQVTDKSFYTYPGQKLVKA